MRSFVALLCVLAGCADPAPARAPRRAPDAGPPSAEVIAPVEALPEPETSGPQVSLAAGTLLTGSAPGTPARRPSVEADLVPVTIPAFAIDRRPYPNDPGAPSLRVTSRAEAAALCEAREQRLCHELEWERACKGERAATYPTGERLDLARCAADPTSCASPAGVLALGLEAPEWTASDAEPSLARLERTVVARGGETDDPLDAHRCAARRAVAPQGRALAFRCCTGPAPELAYPDAGARRVFRDLPAEESVLREALASVPELARFAAAFVPYDRDDAIAALARGGATEADMQWELAPGPFAWSPSAGEEVWVMAGSSGDSALIAALYPMPDGSFRHAASFVLAGETAPIALLRTRGSRGELLWSACWGCAGESGAIRFDESARIVIAQQ